MTRFTICRHRIFVDVIRLFFASPQGRCFGFCERGVQREYLVRQSALCATEIVARLPRRLGEKKSFCEKEGNRHSEREEGVRGMERQWPKSLLDLKTLKDSTIFSETEYSAHRAAIMQEKDVLDDAVYVAVAAERENMMREVTNAHGLIGAGVFSPEDFEEHKGKVLKRWAELAAAAQTAREVVHSALQSPSACNGSGAPARANGVGFVGRAVAAGGVKERSVALVRKAATGGSALATDPSAAKLEAWKKMSVQELATLFIEAGHAWRIVSVSCLTSGHGYQRTSNRKAWKFKNRVHMLVFFFE